MKPEPIDAGFLPTDYSDSFNNMMFPAWALPPWMTMKDLEWPEAMSFSEQLEYLDNNNWDKSQYMKLIKDILHDNGTSALEISIIENAIYSYADAK